MKTIQYKDQIASDFYYKVKTRETQEGFFIRDVSEIRKLPKITQELLDRLDIKLIEFTLHDNIHIEFISQEIYGNARYWDLFFAVNNITSFDELPKDSDIIYERAQERLQSELEILKLVKYSYSDSDKNNLFKKILEEENIKNEKFRNIKIIQPIDVQKIIKYYQENLTKIKLNDKLIVKV